jgi:hypothetical protein
MSKLTDTPKRYYVDRCATSIKKLDPDFPGEFAWLWNLNTSHLKELSTFLAKCEEKINPLPPSLSEPK